jgi:hypothetical protein
VLDKTLRLHNVLMFSVVVATFSGDNAPLQKTAASVTSIATLEDACPTFAVRQRRHRSSPASLTHQHPAEAAEANPLRVVKPPPPVERSGGLQARGRRACKGAGRARPALFPLPAWRRSRLRSAAADLLLRALPARSNSTRWSGRAGLEKRLGALWPVGRRRRSGLRCSRALRRAGLLRRGFRAVFVVVRRDAEPLRPLWRSAPWLLALALFMIAWEATTAKYGLLPRA